MVIMAQEDAEAPPRGSLAGSDDGDCEHFSDGEVAEPNEVHEPKRSTPSPSRVKRGAMQMADEDRRSRVAVDGIHVHELPRAVRSALGGRLVVVEMTDKLDIALRHLRPPRVGVPSDYNIEQGIPVSLRQDGWDIHTDLRDAEKEDTSTSMIGHGTRAWFAGARTKAWVPVMKELNALFEERVRHTDGRDEPPTTDWHTGLLYSEPDCPLQAPHTDHVVDDKHRADREKEFGSAPNPVPIKHRWQAVTSYRGDKNKFLAYVRDLRGDLTELELDLSAGCVVFFTGDLEHAGAPNVHDFGLQRHFFYMHGTSPGDVVDHELADWTIEDLIWQTRVAPELLRPSKDGEARKTDADRLHRERQLEQNWTRENPGMAAMDPPTGK